MTTAVLWSFGLVLKSTLVLGVAAVVCAALRRRAAAERHLIWALALLGCLSLPIVARVMPPLELPVSQAAAAWLREVGPAPQAGGASASGDAAASGASSSDRAADRLGRAAAVGADGAPLASRGFAESTRSAFVLVPAAAYVSIVAALLAYFAIGTFLVWRRAASLAPVESPATLSLIATLRRQMGIRRQVRALVTPSERTPWALGVLRPAIVLPAEYRDWSEEALRGAVIHELAHIARFDQLTLWLGHLSCALYWWQPLAWVALRRMNREAERACDDEVLLAGIRDTSYAEQLLAIANRVLKDAFGPAPATAMARTSFISERIHSILNADTRRTAMNRLQTVFVALAAAALVVPVATLRSQGSPEPAAADRPTDTELGEQVRAHISAGNTDAAVREFVAWLDGAGPGLSGCDYCATLLRDRGDTEAAPERRALLAAFDAVEDSAIESRDADALVRLALIALESRERTALDLGKHYLYEVSTFSAQDPDAQWVWLQYLIEMGRLDDAAALAARLGADASLAPDRAKPLERFSRYIASEIERNDAISGRLFAGTVEPVGEEEFIPIYKAAPVYPREAAAAALEGHAVIEFTVTELGRVKDVFVVSSTAPVFEQPSIDAAQQFRYMPRIVDGVAVEVSGVRNRIAYALE